MITFDKKFFEEYFRSVEGEIKSFKQYGTTGWTVNSQVYGGETIFPLMIKSNGHYSFFNIEYVGFETESKENSFRVRVLSPREIYDGLKSNLENLAKTINKNSKDSPKIVHNFFGLTIM